MSDTPSVLSLFDTFLFCRLSEVCGKCGEALSRTQPAVRAMNQLFHANCFCCMSCHRPLQGMQFYDRDGSPECEDCYMVRTHTRKASDLSNLNISVDFCITVMNVMWNLEALSVWSRCSFCHFFHRIPWQCVPDVGRRSRTAC